MKPVEKAEEPTKMAAEEKPAVMKAAETGRGVGGTVFLCVR